MRDFEVGDMVYASDWCYGEIFELDDEGAYVSYETPGGGGSFFFPFEELTFAEPIPTIPSLRDKLLVIAGARATYMDYIGDIDIPGGLEAEDDLAKFVVEAVDTYIKLPEDIPFDIFIETELKCTYGKDESDV